MNSHYSLSVELTLTGPLLTPGGEMAAPGLDAALARDRFGRFILPFSLVKGKALDAMRDLGVDPELRQNWFGIENGEGNFEPDRGLLRFSDFHTDEPGDPDNVMERIRLDADSGSTVKGALQMVQAPFGYGQRVKFVGTVDFIACEDDAKRIEQEINRALRWTPSFGALRSIGFGRTLSVETELSSADARSSVSIGSRETIPFRLTLDRPLCIVGPKHSTNHFESLETISGSVLKGALAQMLLQVSGTNKRFIDADTCRDYRKLCEHFEKIRFAEARPQKSDSTRRPVEPPLSIVRSPFDEHKNQYFDVALYEVPQLIGGVAPAFRPDWKDSDYECVYGAFGGVWLPRERRTRTRINEETFRAKDEQLFSYGLVLPELTHPDGTATQYVWEGTIGLEEVPAADRQTVADELAAALEFGLPGIGKTRATGTIEWLDEATPPAVGCHESGYSGWIIVTLQTECLMTNPGILKKGGTHAMKDAYSEFWSDVSGGALSLRRFFAQQTLYGGYVSRRANSDRYEPFLLTNRGSVFVLDIKNAENAAELKQKWQTCGLPIPKWVAERYGSNGKPLWKRCPYLPHVGYGEVAIDLECHQQQPAAVAAQPPTPSPCGGPQ